MNKKNEMLKMTVRERARREKMINRKKTEKRKDK